MLISIRSRSLPLCLLAQCSLCTHTRRLAQPLRSQPRKILVRRQSASTASTPSTEHTPEEQGKLKVVESLPSGRAVKTLSSVPGTQTVDSLPPELVQRLVKDYVSQKPPLNIGRRGVWKALADDVHMRWKTKEVVKLDAVHDKPKGDMKATALALEEHTGGIVIWRSGSKILLYRGFEAEEGKRPKMNAKPKKARNILQGAESSAVQK